MSMDEPWLQGGFLDGAADQASPTSGPRPGRNVQPPQDWSEGLYEPDEDPADSGPQRPPPADWDSSAGSAAADYYAGAACFHPCSLCLMRAGTAPWLGVKCLCSK